MGKLKNWAIRWTMRWCCGQHVYPVSAGKVTRNDFWPARRNTPPVQDINSL